MQGTTLLLLIFVVLLLLFMVAPGIVLALAEGAGGMVKAIGTGLVHGLIG